MPFGVALTIAGLAEAKLIDLIRKHFKLTPKGIILSGGRNVEGASLGAVSGNPNGVADIRMGAGVMLTAPHVLLAAFMDLDQPGNAAVVAMARQASVVAPPKTAWPISGTPRRFATTPCWNCPTMDHWWVMPKRGWTTPPPWSASFCTAP